MDRLIAPNTVVAGQADIAPATGSPGYATDGNPATGTPATLWPSYQYNAIQEELIAILTAAGITPDRTTNSQIASAIKRLVQRTIILADTGAANAYAAANTPPLTVATWLDGTVQQVKIANSNTGTSTYAPDGLTAIPIYGLGLQPLQGGELAAGGAAVLMRATIAGVNSGNPICVLMECSGGAQQVAPATQSRHAVQLGQLSGVVGSVRNLVMSVTTASATATLTADEIVVETALGGIRYCLSNFSKTINLATTGAGGMDTGSAPASGYIALYAIYNPTTGASALLAMNATAAKVPEVYGGSNMPSGYTASALVSVVPTSGGGQFTAFTQRDRSVAVVNRPIISTSSGSSTPQPYTTTAFPKNAVRVKGYSSFTTGVASTVNAGIYADAAGSDQSTVGGTFTGAQGIAGSFDVLINQPQTIYYTLTSSSGAPSWGANCERYDF